jgi:hypothetical protein
MPSLAWTSARASTTPLPWTGRGRSSSTRPCPSSRKGNKILKRALFLYALAALKDPLSRAYYDPKRAEGKRRNHALIALARRRCDTLFAMLRDGTFYEPQTHSVA